MQRSVCDRSDPIPEGTVRAAWSSRRHRSVGGTGPGDRGRPAGRSGECRSCSAASPGRAARRELASWQMKIGTPARVLGRREVARPAPGCADGTRDPGGREQPRRPGPRADDHRFRPSTAPASVRTATWRPSSLRPDTCTPVPDLRPGQPRKARSATVGADHADSVSTRAGPRPTPGNLAAASASGSSSQGAPGCSIAASTVSHLGAERELRGRARAAARRDSSSTGPPRLAWRAGPARRTRDRRSRAGRSGSCRATAARAHRPSPGRAATTSRPRRVRAQPADRPSRPPPTTTTSSGGQSGLGRPGRPLTSRGHATPVRAGARCRAWCPCRGPGTPTCRRAAAPNTRSSRSVISEPNRSGSFSVLPGPPGNRESPVNRCGSVASSPFAS